MGQGLVTCLSPGEGAPAEEVLEAAFARCLVCQAGLVLAGSKPAALFCFHAPADAPAREVARLVSVYAQGLEGQGIRLVPLASRGGSTRLLVWGEPGVEALLACEEARDVLDAAGIDTHGAVPLMSDLAARLERFYAGAGEFPHVLGLVLGYPAEDVRGFMADGGRNARACGRWMVYGDVARARERMERLDQEERHLRRLYSEGVPIRGLLRPNAA